MVFVNNVSENMKAFTKKDIKGANREKQLYAKLMYPLDMDFLWVVQNNHIKNCDMTIRNIDVAQEIWRNYIDALKGKTSCSKPNVVAKERTKIQRELQKLKKTVFLTADLFFVIGIPFLFCSAERLTLQQ